MLIAALAFPQATADLTFANDEARWVLVYYTRSSRLLSYWFDLMRNVASFLSQWESSMHARHYARILVGGLAACLTCAVVAQAVSGTPSVASKADIKFVKNAAADGVAEVKLAQLALEKSANADVKTLAQRIVGDHSQANDKLRTLAQGKQIMLAPPPASDPALA
ncbi:MAG: DUF4142 domain-containing protein, partial [Pseudomonadota bacterium]|nr:DUF4142 domain-containing protein [Pseudomonadota bacterium]